VGAILEMRESWADYYRVEGEKVEWRELANGVKEEMGFGVD